MLRSRRHHPSRRRGSVSQAQNEQQARYNHPRQYAAYFIQRDTRRHVGRHVGLNHWTRNSVSRLRIAVSVHVGFGAKPRFDFRSKSALLLDNWLRAYSIIGSGSGFTVNLGSGSLGKSNNFRSVGVSDSLRIQIHCESWSGSDNRIHPESRFWVPLDAK